MEFISSLQNTRIKNIIKLEKASERKSQGLFVIEGYREINLAIQSGYIVDSLFFFPALAEKTSYQHWLNANFGFALFEISKEVFEKIAYRESSDGLIALAKPKKHSLSELKLSSNPLIMVLEAVEKPGNLGAIMRTADAAALDAVIVCDPRTDVYNPNAIRSSIGCVFTRQLAVCTNQEAQQWLKDKGIISYAASLEAKESYHKKDFTQPTAFIMGTEADGLSEFWMKNSDQYVIIPMCGIHDSLNVSTASAILAFEAKRQRGFL